VDWAGFVSPSVVIVDAERVLAESMAVALEASLGVGTVRVVTTASSCHEAIAEKSVDLAILSCAIGNANPFEVCAVLAPQTNVVVVPRDQELDGALVRTLESGGLGVVSPDIGVPELIRTVQAALRGEACVPRGLLGEVLRLLVQRRRTDREVLDRYSRLTARERQTLLQMARGLSNEQIAADLVVSTSTVRSHAQHVLDKLEVHSRSEAITIAIEHQLVDPRTGDVHP